MFNYQNLIIDVYIGSVTAEPISFDLEFDKVKNLKITGQIDATCQSLPLGGMTVEVCSDTDLQNAVRVVIIRWGWKIARDYRVKSVQLLTDGYVRIEGESWLALLDDVELPDEMLEGDSLSNMVRYVDPHLPLPVFFVVDFQNAPPIYGYAPEQSGRDRLVWLMYTVGGFISDDESTYVNYALTFKPFPSQAVLIPAQNTLHKPTVTLKEKTSEVVVTSYAFTTTESMLLDENDYRFPDGWTALEVEFSSNDLPPDPDDDQPLELDDQLELDSPVAEGEGYGNKVSIDNIYFVTSGNGLDILKRLSKYYMNRRVVTLDVLNADWPNGELPANPSGFMYKAGDRVIAYTEIDRLVTGIVEKIIYSFGNNIRCSMELACVEDVQGGWLNINYKCNNVVIGHDRQYYPIGYAFTIANRDIRRARGRRVTVYTPTEQKTTGVLTSDGQTLDIAYTIQP